MASPSTHLYLQIAGQVAQAVANGTIKTAQRVPSVRDAAAQHNVSTSTVVQAFSHLEEHGVIQPRPKAGYFVATHGKNKAAAFLRRLVPVGEVVTTSDGNPNDKIGACAEQAFGASFVGFCSNDKDLFGTDKIRIALAKATRLQRNTLAQYVNSTGTLALRSAVAQRALYLGCALKPDNIVITGSCIQSVEMCLQAVTKPGDLVAVESPTFYGFLDLLEMMGRKALPVPTDPRTGVSLPALQLALDTQPIKAVLLVPTLSNPLASIMPLKQKRALAQLMAQYQVPLIEDLVFNDLLATDARRRAVKAFDTEGWVMACGSFSKTVAPGIRLGWVEAGRWSKEMATQKRLKGSPTNAVLEHALADLLTQGSYEAHLRRLCNHTKLRLDEARKIIQQHFPAGTSTNTPPSGYTLWVKMPDGVHALALFEACKAQGIAIGPGQLFCDSQRYHNYLRLSFAGPWGAHEKSSLAEVGRQAALLAVGGGKRVSTPSFNGDRSDFMNDWVVG